jgi:hypothetical protein
MSQTRRWFEIAAALPVLAVFAALYAWAAPLGDPTQRFDAYLWLALAFAMPTMLWLLTSWLLVHHWWTSAGARLPATDAPSWLLGTALATMPEPRQHWGQAMLSELARVRGRTAAGGSRSAVRGQCCFCPSSAADANACPRPWRACW